jgi:2-polyprenyl-6-methoxyphenol hydroxylase-like FAD-dependent oxidoreductase
MSATTDTDVLIVGGGPAGALLGYLLARQGVPVVVVEKELDLERSFRGETIAARSVHTLYQLGFGPALERHGFIELTGISLWEKRRRIIHADYRRFPIKALPIDIPQPALIGAFLEAARPLSSFVLHRGARFNELLEEHGAVVGANVTLRDNTRLAVRARIVIGADGRFSKVRKVSGLPAIIEPMARDFLWFKLPRPADWGSDGQLVVEQDKHLVILPTWPDMLRVGYNLPKHGFSDIRKQGFEAFKAGIAQLDPRLAPLVEENIKSWSDTSFLEIFTAEMNEWARDGLLLIGDAAHTATPILGQGVNLAIQDAVLLAPLLISLLASGEGAIKAAALADFVQKRRAHKDMVTRFQRIQEKNLAQYKPLKTLLRRARLKALDLFPFKYQLLDKVMNSPHDLDAAVFHDAAE